MKKESELRAIWDEREKWFQDRIGKRVFRNKNTCKCKTCEDVSEKGIIISDTYHASYLHDCESEMNLDYRDSI